MTDSLHEELNNRTDSVEEECGCQPPQLHYDGDVGFEEKRIMCKPHADEYRKKLKDSSTPSSPKEEFEIYGSDSPKDNKPQSESGGKSRCVHGVIWYDCSDPKCPPGDTNPTTNKECCPCTCGHGDLACEKCPRDGHRWQRVECELAAPTINGWEEEFRSMWQTNREAYGKFEKVKSFIHTVLAAEREKAFSDRDIYVNQAKQKVKEAHIESKEKFIALAEGMKKPTAKSFDGYELGKHNGYWNALTDLISQVRKEI